MKEPSHKRRTSFSVRYTLTYSEGISKDKFKRTKIEVFPHYTWGYIALVHLISDFLTVPSLYVRVYRTLTPGNCFCSRSLTIREGISKDKFKRTKIEVFPHYTWGYIALVHLISDFLTVPSLYVRVYRTLTPGNCFCSRSLTIREGISKITIYPHV